jgi:hypothetical protein
VGDQAWHFLQAAEACSYRFNQGDEAGHSFLAVGCGFDVDLGPGEEQLWLDKESGLFQLLQHCW